MPIETLVGPLSEVRAASTAGGGSALTVSTTVSTPFLAGTNYVSMEGRNYTTAVVIRYGLIPYILVYKTADGLATVTDYTSEALIGVYPTGQPAPDCDIESARTCLGIRNRRAA